MAHGRGELLTLELTVPAGGRHDLVLEIADGTLATDPPDPAGTWRATEAAWARARPPLEQTIAPPPTPGPPPPCGRCDQLARDEYVYRFRHDQRPLGGPEGAFLLCGFIMALAQHQQGHELAAIRYFERNRAACARPACCPRDTT